MKPNMQVNLGDRARDVISGFEGIVVARIRYLTGCDRITLEGPYLEAVKSEDSWRTFDITRIEVTEAGAIKLALTNDQVNAEQPAGTAPG